MRRRLEVCQLSYLISLEEREKWHIDPSERRSVRHLGFQSLTAFGVGQVTWSPHLRVLCLYDRTRAAMCIRIRTKPMLLERKIPVFRNFLLFFNLNGHHFAKPVLNLKNGLFSAEIVPLVVYTRCHVCEDS